MPTPTPANVYILRLRSGALYVARDPSRRWKEHVEGHGSGRTTTRDPPLSVFYSESHASITSALRRERQLKRWTRAKKEARIAHDLCELRRLSRSRGLTT